tara:strand:+ start:436 stop:732 length:297 start_codon:yes stop_codon:yes gene_type:complete
MDRDYLQDALMTFNGGTWYGWKKTDSDGNKIPNNQRMTYANIEVIKVGATIPSEADVNTKIQEIKNAETNTETKKASGKQKLLNLGLTEEEVQALIGA